MHLIPTATAFLLPLHPQFCRATQYILKALDSQRFMLCPDFHMADISGKACSICGLNFPVEEFSHGNKGRRSHGRACDKACESACSTGGVEGARAFREEQRAMCRGEV